MKRAFTNLSFLFLCSFLFLALVQPSVQKNLNAKSALLARGERHQISLNDPGLKEALEAVKSEIFVNCSRLSSFSAVKAEARTDDPIRYWATVLRLDFEEFEEPPKKSRCKVVIDKLLAPKEYHLSSINCTAFSRKEAPVYLNNKKSKEEFSVVLP